VLVLLVVKAKSPSATQHTSCLYEARISWKGCGKKGILHKIGGIMVMGSPSGLSARLPLLSSPHHKTQKMACNVGYHPTELRKARNFAHPLMSMQTEWVNVPSGTGSPGWSGERAIKWSRVMYVLLDVKTPLPEDSDLECFLPVNKALRYAATNEPFLL